MRAAPQHQPLSCCVPWGTCSGVICAPCVLGSPPPTPCHPQLSGSTTHGSRGAGEGRRLSLLLLPSSLPPFEWRFKGCKLAGLGCLLVLPAGRIEAQPRRPSRLQRGRCLQQSQSSRLLLPSSLSPLEGGIPLSRREPAHRPGPAQLLWLLPPLCLLGGSRGESQTPPGRLPRLAVRIPRASVVLPSS